MMKDSLVADERHEQLALADRLSRLVISNLSSQELCQRILAELAALVEVDLATLAFIDRPGESVDFSILVSGGAGTSASTVTIPLADTPFAWVAQNKRALLESGDDNNGKLPSGLKAEDWVPEDQFTRTVCPFSHGIRSLVHMPLFSQGDVYGVFSIGSRHSQAYGDTELKLAKHTAMQLAIGIENRRLLQENKERAQREAQLVSLMSYGLKTPLTPLVSASTLLQDELRGQPQSPEARLAQIVYQSAQTMEARLIKLLEIAAVTVPSLRLELESMDIKPWLEEMAKTAQAMARKKSRKLAVELADSLPVVRGDARRLQQTLRILLDNAIQSSPEGETIRLRVNQGDIGVVAAVQDHGQAFSPEQRDRLLGNRYLSEFDRESFPELALDIVICRRLIELHGGRLWLESEPGKGNTFSFSLPSGKGVIPRAPGPKGEPLGDRLPGQRIPVPQGR